MFLSSVLFLSLLGHPIWKVTYTVRIWGSKRRMNSHTLGKFTTQAKGACCCSRSSMLHSKCLSTVIYEAPCIEMKIEGNWLCSDTFPPVERQETGSRSKQRSDIRWKNFLQRSFEYTKPSPAQSALLQIHKCVHDVGCALILHRRSLSIRANRSCEAVLQKTDLIAARSLFLESHLN